MDRKAAENLLKSISEEDLFQSYAFCENSDGLCLLGQSATSYVYEVYEKANSDKKYALKIIGLKGINLSHDKFVKMVELQQRACDITKFVAKLFSYDEITVSAEEGEVVLQCVLMEKLEHIINMISSSQRVYVRKELESRQEKLKLITEIGTALAVLHQEGIFHRDVKLENIFYSAEDDCYKLGDFSVSIYTETGNADTIIYTDGYGAPEIVSKTGAVYDATVDMYSFGIVIYLLLNHLKFPGSNGYLVNPAHYNKDFLFPACEEGTEAWNNLIRKMCHHQAEKRYSSMNAVLKEINRITGNGESEADMEVMDTRKYSMEPTVAYQDELEEGPASNKNRYEKKSILGVISYYYDNRNKWYGVFLTAFFAMLLGTMEPELLGILDMDWQPRLMLCLVIIEIILLHQGELYILFGIGTMLAGICFMLSTGQYVLFAVLLLGVVYGIPTVGIAGVAGIALWNILDYFRWNGYQEFILTHHLQWLLITVIFLLINRVIILRRECAACDSINAMYERLLYCIVPMIFIALGIISKRTELIRDIQLLKVLQSVNIGLVGVLVLAGNVVGFIKHFNYPRFGEYMWDEYKSK